MNFFEAYARYIIRENSTRKLLTVCHHLNIYSFDKISSRDVSYFLDKMKYCGD